MTEEGVITPIADVNSNVEVGAETEDIKDMYVSDGATAPRPQDMQDTDLYLV